VVEITFEDDLMNEKKTHEVLYAIRAHPNDMNVNAGVRLIHLIRIPGSSEMLFLLASSLCTH